MQSTNNSNVQSRESLMKDIETRFRFLAADSLETLRGEHPSYRETLTHIQKKYLYLFKIYEIFNFGVEQIWY